MTLALPALLPGWRACAGNDHWTAIRSPGYLVLMRHALAPGNFDPPGFQIEDCTTQRNLSAEGRAQATRIGGMFRAHGIAAAAVYSSQWCRCLETAALLTLGSVAPQPLLNSFVQDAAQAARQVPAVKTWIAGLSLDRPTILVTHQVVITALADVFPGNGEIVVLRRDAAGGLVTVGRIATD